MRMVIINHVINYFTMCSQFNLAFLLCFKVKLTADTDVISCRLNCLKPTVSHNSFVTSHLKFIYLNSKMFSIIFCITALQRNFQYQLFSLSPIRALNNTDHVRLAKG